MSWTKAAEAYPHSLCRFLAKAVYESLKPGGAATEAQPGSLCSLLETFALAKPKILDLGQAEDDLMYQT